MFSSFLHSLLTKHTIVTTFQIFSSPPEHIPRIQLVIKQEPGKELDLRHTFGFSNPKDRIFRLDVPESEMVISVGGVYSIAPDESPGIKIILLRSRELIQ
jgi:hypothetical protein